MKNEPFKNIERLLAQKRDANLIKAALNNDSKAFEKLVNLYKKRVTVLGKSFFKNDEDTADFVQEVFVKVYTNLSQFRGDSSFSTWITRVAYNTAINSLNRRQEYVPLANEELLEGRNLTPEEEELRRITMEAVREALTDLPEKYSVCLELYFFHDFSYDEIEAITNFPLNTIKSNIFRAKKILRDKLRGYYEN